MVGDVDHGDDWVEVSVSIADVARQKLVETVGLERFFTGEIAG